MPQVFTKVTLFTVILSTVLIFFFQHCHFIAGGLTLTLEDEIKVWGIRAGAMGIHLEFVDLLLYAFMKGIPMDFFSYSQGDFDFVAERF